MGTWTGRAAHGVSGNADAEDAREVPFVEEHERRHDAAVLAHERGRVGVLQDPQDVLLAEPPLREAQSLQLVQGVEVRRVGGADHG